MKCPLCHNEFSDGVAVTEEGDFVCSEKCVEAWKKEQDHFLNDIVHQEGLYNKWMESTVCSEQSDKPTENTP